MITLRPWEPGDADAVLAAIDEEILRWIPHIPSPYRLADAIAFVSDPPDDVSCAVVCDGEVAGSIGMRHFTYGTGHLGYWCAPPYRGRGVMAAALRRFCAAAFADGLARLELVADPANARSLRLAERVGFTREGVLRSATVYRDGRRADVVMLSLLPGELT